MKLARSTVSVCFNYSTGFRNNDFSSFKNSTKEARLLMNDILSIRLAYLKDSNAAAHSVDSDIFQSSDSSICALQDLTWPLSWGICPCMHQLHAWWDIDGELWQGIVTKNHCIIWIMIHVNLSFTRSRKSKDVSSTRPLRRVNMH